MFGRRHVKSRRDLVRAEFGETMDHVRQAAAHAAGGLGATVGPRLGSAKESARNRTSSARGFVGPAAGRVGNAASHGWDQALAAFAPLAEAAREGSARAAKLDSKGHKGKRGKNKKEVSRLSFTASESESNGHTGLYVLLATGAAMGAAGALVARRRTRAKWAEYEPSSLHSDATSFRDAGATSTKSFGGDDMETDTDDATGAVTKATTWTKEHAKSAVDTLRHKIHEATAERTDDASDLMEKASDKVNEGASHLADKADAKFNAATPTGGSPTNTSAAASRTSDRIEDEVDDLIRSAKNGRM